MKMELWIRSQDREDLIKVDNLGLAYKGKYTFVDNDRIDDKFYICQFTPDFHTKLGEYTTKERALEVLDEIQDILKPRNLIYTGDKINMKDAMHLCKMTNSQSISLLPSDASITQLGVLVYEMPEK